ncbi:MAG: type II toxin-antitoxin system Phd/YefM family antitoxin [Candidatus Omnitrophica bacterium]|nr:type II toxin-antitoxin system Phd/YefM family antitoxin [Candidatus Omnitrophota bacterium]
MIMTATQLRKQIYTVIDQVNRTGVPVEITRKGSRSYWSLLVNVPN